jgi:hypothetical protein
MARPRQFAGDWTQQDLVMLVEQARSSRISGRVAKECDLPADADDVVFCPDARLTSICRLASW